MRATNMHHTLPSTTSPFLRSRRPRNSTVLSPSQLLIHGPQTPQTPATAVPTTPRLQRPPTSQTRSAIPPTSPLSPCLPSAPTPPRRRFPTTRVWDLSSKELRPTLRPPTQTSCACKRRNSMQLDAVCTMTCDAQINEVKAHAAQRRVSHNALTRHLICFFIARFATCVRQQGTMRSGAECIGCSQSASIQLYSDIYRRKHKLLLSSPRHSRVSSTQDCSFRKFVSP